MSIMKGLIRKGGHSKELGWEVEESLKPEETGL